MTLFAVAWDIDGTLIDSEPLHLEALLVVCDSYDVNLHNLPEDTFRGVHNFDVLKTLEPRFDGRVSRDVWLDAITEVYIARSAKLEPQPGVSAAMESLARDRVPQVCVSNSNRRVVDANIAALGIQPLVQFSISLDDVKNGKPNAEPYVQALTRLGMQPAAMVVVEDSASGITSGRAAGSKVIGYSPDDKRMHDVDATVANLADVPHTAWQLISGRSQAAGC
jgi:HAD superfamily hydrolase (TIGR01509 family)